MLEKDIIMKQLLARIVNHPLKPQVTEDFSKSAALAEGGATFVPTCIVVERPDLILRYGQLGDRPTDMRQGYVSVVSFIRARSCELGPTDMRKFRIDLLRGIYDTDLRKIGNSGIIKEKQTGQCKASPQDHEVFAQEIIFRIDYYDTIGDIFPTT